MRNVRRVQKPSSSRLTAVCACLLLIGAAAGPGHALPIGSPGSLSAGNNVITFEEFSAGSSGPIGFGGLTIDSTTPGAATVRPQGFPQFSGIFEGQFFGAGALNYFVDFNGSVVSEFGIGVFDPNFSGNVLRALDIGGNVLESIVSSPSDPNFTVGPIGGVHSTFVGFVRPTADIARIELIAAPGDLLGIDTITYSDLETSPVPEPSPALLLLAGLAWLRRFSRCWNPSRQNRL